MDVVSEVKNCLKPMIAPNKDVMDAVKHLFRGNQWENAPAASHKPEHCQKGPEPEISSEELPSPRPEIP